MDKKEGIMTSTINDYMELPKDKKMYILGFMQGILMKREERSVSAECVNTQKSSN